jgi:DNA-binding response OmpR family regulator
MGKEVALTPRVLIVDDNTNLAHLAAYSLKSAIDGLEVLTAGSCQEALILAKEHRPSVFIVDLKLPDGDGLGLIDELKRRWPCVVPVLATATPLRGDLDRGLFGVLVKPYDPDDLIDLVRQALNSADTPSRPSMAGQLHLNETAVPSSQYDSHYVQNRLSGLLAGIRALRLELIAVADDPSEVRRIVDEYAERLSAMVKDAGEAVKRGAGRR